MKLASGKCRLRIFDLRKSDTKEVRHLRPVIVIVSDVPESGMSIKSCAGHIATKVAEAFCVDPLRMLFIEYYPAVTYGEDGKNTIPERYESVAFTWIENKAIQPRWRTLKTPLLETVMALMKPPEIKHMERLSK